MTFEGWAIKRPGKGGIMEQTIRQSKEHAIMSLGQFNQFNDPRWDDWKSTGHTVVRVKVDEVK